MTTTTADELFDRILSRVLENQRDAVVGVAAEIKRRINTPVGPNGQRSKPGEYPRRDTGRLQASIDAEAVQQGNRIEAAVYTDVRYAPILEDKDRLVITYLKEQTGEVVAQASADAFNGV